MHKLKLYILIFFLTSLPVIGAANKGFNPKETKEYNQAESEYKKHNYLEASNLYKQIYNSKSETDTKKQAGLKYLDSLLQIKSWDTLTAEFDKYLKLYPNTVWQARAYKIGGEIYQQIPHGGYKRNGKVYRNTTVREGDYIGTYDEDRKLVLEYYQSAKELYYKQTPAKEINQEIINFNFDFAHFLSYNPYYYGAIDVISKNNTISNRYNPKTEIKTQVLFLYDEVFTLNKLAKEPHNEARALFKKAGYFITNNGIARNYTNEQNKAVKKEDPLPLLQRLVNNYSNDPLAPEAMMGIAQIHNSFQEFVKAINTYESLIKKYPKSIRVSDAKAEIQNIKSKSLSVSIPGVQQSNSKAKITINSKNINEISVKVYKTDLVSILKANLDNYSANFYNFNSNFGDKIENSKKYFKDRVVSLKFPSGDKEDYKSISKEISLPSLKPGAYLVLTEGDTTNSSLSLLLISDITIVKNIDKNKVYVYILDRETGKPIPNTNVIVKEHYYSKNSSYEARYKQTTSDSNGLVTYDKYDNTTYNSYYEVLAWKNDQISFSDAQYYYGYYNQEKTYKAYLNTDRPVYRPDQTVYFKEIVRFSDGNYKNVPDEKLQVTITNPKGDVIYKKALTTNKFGSINDSFKLGKNVPLGVYYINTTFADTTKYMNQSSGQNFRVEEYKKPEYIVNVTSDINQLKPGDPAKVKINATYYFGSPVADAKVHYKVMRTPYYYYYYPRGRYGWLYGYGYYESYNKIYNPRFQQDNQGTVWKEGDLTTDKDGNSFVDFDTEKSQADYKYDILVDVTDKSRRDIKGAGTIKVTQTYFYAFIEADQGFYTPGEKASIEVNLRNPDDQPVQASGELKIFKVRYTGTKNEKEETTPIFSDKFTSNAEGRIFYKWKAPSEGYYKFHFETKDKDDKTVIGEKYIWVNGNNFSGKYYKFQNIEILTDKKTYEEGETVRVMLSTDYPDSYVMLFTESDNTIFSNKMVYIPSKSKLLEIKIGKHHVPNFNIKAVMVRNNQLFLENHEVFVPPANQFLNVELSTNKSEYKPGDKAVMTVKTTNNKGKPVSSEVSLSVVDSSVYYIQEDVSEDIKLYYYGGRRAFQNALTSSINIYAYGLNENYEKYENYKRHRDPFGYYYGNEMESDEVSDALAENAPAPSVGKTAMRSEATGMAQKNMMDKKDVAPSSPKLEEKAKENLKKQAPGATLKEAEIRSYFPDTAAWRPTLTTDKNGKAKVEFSFPDSLTTWRANLNAIDLNSRVGSNKKDIITRKNLLIRMQAPRFFVERDEITLSGIVNNDLTTAKQVQVELGVGDELENTSPEKLTITVPAKGEKRIDWKVKVKKEGNTRITMKALTDEESDAVQMDFPVYIHGIEKYVAQSGVLKNESTKDLSVVVPQERKKGSTSLEITLSPSVISSLIEALPYLATYPYGCVEQTTSRFIPLVLISKTLKNLNVDLNNIQDNKNLDVKEMARMLDKKARNPVYDRVEIEKMVKTGLERLYGFQNSDGGFGWWSGFTSDTYMSAYVVHGLLLAKESDYSVNETVLENGLNFLSKQLIDKDNEYDDLFVSYVLSMAKRVKATDLDPMFKKRDTFNNYGKALLSLAYANIGEKAKADLICQNLKSFATVDKDTQTASWNNEERWYWYWYGDRIETNAYILKAFLKSRPNDTVVPMLAKWLLTNREGNHWYSTKDTANTIYALSSYAVINKETSPDYTLSVLYNGKVIRKIKVNKDNMFSFDNRIVLNDNELSEGKGKITIKKEGKGTVYYSANLKYFTLEEDIKGAGSQLDVKREYYKLTERKDENAKIFYDKKLITYNQVMKSGDLIEVKLTIKANNDYEYLIFEDMKPSGFEATDLKSGYIYQNGVSINRELKDEKVVFFMDNFQQGTQVLTYQLKAEIPGKFHVIPHKAYAMYAPKVRAISDEMRIQTVD